MSGIKENGSIKPDVILLSAKDYLDMLEGANNGRLDIPLLQKFLSTMPSHEEPQSRYQMHNIVEAVGEPQRLISIIDSILGSFGELEAITLRSFGHSTGMERIELASEGQYSLRLHFWMPGKNESFTEDPHNHAYNFSSKILSGVLVTDLFAQGDVGEEMDMFQIASQNTQNKPTPEHLGNARLQPVSTPGGIVFSDSDTAYTMSHEVIHRVRQYDPTMPIITLNIRGGAIEGRSTFFRDRRDRNIDSTPTPIDVEARLNLLRNILINKT